MDEIELHRLAGCLPRCACPIIGPSIPSTSFNLGLRWLQLIIQSVGWIASESRNSGRLYEAEGFSITISLEKDYERFYIYHHLSLFIPWTSFKEILLIMYKEHRPL